MDSPIIETLTDAVFILDNGWQFTYLNAIAEKLLGQPRQSLLNRCIWEIFPELIGGSFEQEYRRVMTQQVTSHFEAFFPVGKTWVEARIAPYREGISVCLRDVSERKRVEADLLERSRLAHLEANISRYLVRSHSLHDSLQYCTQTLIEELDAAIAAIWTYNPQTEQLERQGLEAHPEIPPKLLESDLFSNPYLTLEGSVIGMIANSLQPIYDLVFPVFGDLSRKTLPPETPGEDEKPDPLFCHVERAKLPHNSKLHLIGYPLVLEDRLFGVLALWAYHPLNETLQEGLETLADNLAIDIDRCQARTALLNRREALLFRLANQIRNSLDLNTILETAVQEIRTLLNVDFCTYLWCWSQEELSLIVSHEAAKDDQHPSLMSTCDSDILTPFYQPIETLKILRIDNTEHLCLPHLPDEDVAAVADLLEDLEVKSILLLPLKTRSNHLGAIACSHLHGLRHWSDQEVEVLQAVVDQLALAVDHAELFAQTRATALAAQTQAQQLESTLQQLKKAQAQLIQTEKMSSLGQMVAGIAHEINNPVNFISGNLSYTNEYVHDLLELVTLYQKYYPDPKAEVSDFMEEIDFEFVLEDLPKTLSSMQIGAERIRQIVLSLRNFSRLDQAEMKPVDIHEGIDNTLLILHNRLKAKGDRPEVEIEKQYGELPKVECYAGQLNQVFMNIISNAIDAVESQPEPHRITITTEGLLDDPPGEDDEETISGDVIIRIRDNGSGMSSDTVKHIFDPFFTTKPVGKGTGLGLAISYQIVVEKHQGRLECISEVGQGTEFVIQIPIQPFRSLT
ncbi:ATP-binding protein [Spirulina sp. CS-785/01]|uniref:ATP-binding protein n=1 Tax=Spirulina sp. CS-785/01 TaxID=3021716 RepID=UPI00232E6BC9|nr:ATP-binding protein [Spirulina sp. CS-785/01]MDB9312078.1 ATP-binding protein [Spirulina sp. CS-785/01]